MKKSKLQVMIDFISQVSQISSKKTPAEKDVKKDFFKKLRFLALINLLCITAASATTYYSRSSNNWNVNTTWSTVGYGNPTNTGTFPVAGDIVNIGNGYTIKIASNSACATLNVGQGTSGILEYNSTGNYALIVSGNITLNTGAIMRYNSAVNHTHQLSVAGNFANYGTVTFFFAVNQVVNLVFNSSTTSNVTGTGTWTLNNVTLSKTTSTATQLNVQSNTFEAGIKNLIATYGTYVHNNTSSYAINPSVSNFTIASNVIFKIPLGSVSFSSLSDQLILQGSLYVNGGTVFVGTSAGLEGIRSDRSGTFTPYLEVSSGNLIVYGGISYSTASGTEPFSFNMTGGSILLNAGTTGTNREVFCVNDVASSIFAMSGGSIVIQKPNVAGVLVADLDLCGTNGTVASTAGTIYFGNGVTAASSNFNFIPKAAAVYPNFRISGPAAATTTLYTSYASTASFKLLSLYIEANKRFDIRSIGGTAGDTKTMTLTKTCNGVEALYNSGTFNPRQSTVTFNPTGAQAIGGTVSTTFYNLSINNANGITLNRATSLTNYLSMVNGKLFTTNTNVLTCGSAANASIGSAGSYVDGPMIHTVATTGVTNKIYPIGKAAAYRPVVINVRHNSTAAVTYRSEVFNIAASSLPYTLPPTISTVSHVRYVKFTRQPVSNFVSGNIQMYYNTDDVVADKNTLAVAEDNGASAWVNIAGTATANWTGSITSGNFANFNSYFSLANPPGGGNPLPVELSSFTASLNGNHVDLKWTTQSEINNNFFTIERSSDNESFSETGIVEGAGNSTVTHNYSLTDNNPLKGISYYRLKQTDLDGQTEISGTSVVNNLQLSSFTVYPNPAKSNTVHLSTEGQLKNITVSVQDITGKIIPSKSDYQEGRGIDLTIDETYTSSGGIYIISTWDGITSMKQKLVIN